MNVPITLGGSEPKLRKAAGLLGGAELLGHRTDNRLDIHDMVVQGIPAKALDHFLNELVVLHRDHFLDGALGVSLRTMQRHKEIADRVLSREQSGRAWKAAEILASAIEVFGSRAEAESWLDRPAIGLDQRRPIDLLATAAGTEIVETLLGRLDHGVYA